MYETYQVTDFCYLQDSIESKNSRIAWCSLNKNTFFMPAIFALKIMCDWFSRRWRLFAVSFARNGMILSHLSWVGINAPNYLAHWLIHIGRINKCVDYANFFVAGTEHFWRSNRRSSTHLLCVNWTSGDSNKRQPMEKRRWKKLKGAEETKAATWVTEAIGRARYRQR